MPTKKIASPRDRARRPVADTTARNSALAAHEEIERLKQRLAKPEKYADRIASARMRLAALVRP